MRGSPRLPTIQMRLLGSFAVARGATDLTGALAQPKRLALVTWLALSRPTGLHRRDTLCALLWGESSDEKARAALRQLLLVLRRELGEGAFVGEGDLIGINPDVVSSDAGAVLDALDAGDDIAAVSLYTGDLLPGLHVGEAEAFERWFEERRRELRDGVARAAWRLVDRAEEQGNITEARHAAERAMGIDPADESGVRRVMTLQAQSGDRAAALRTHEAFARHLEQEWGTEPEEATRALAHRLRVGQLTGRIQPRVEPPAEPASRPVALSESATPLATTGEPTSTTGPPSPSTGPSGQVRTEGAPRRVRRTWWLIGGATTTAAVVIAIVALTAPRRPGAERPIKPNRVLVAAFENRTGDVTLDGLGTLTAHWIADGLLQSGATDVVDPVTSYYAVQDVGRDSTARAPTDRLRALAEAGAAGTVITGEIQSVGDSVVWQVQISDATKNRLIGSFRVPVPAREASTTGVGNLRQIVAGFVAARLDPNLASVGSEQLPPPRLDAYREYLRGLEYFRVERYSDALQAFLAAAHIDSMFVLPVIWAYHSATNQDSSRMPDSLNAVMLSLLVRLGPRLSPLDRFGLESLTALDAGARREARAAAAALAPSSNWAYVLGRSYPFDFRRELRIYEAIDRQRGWARGWVGFYADFCVAAHFAGENERMVELAREGIAAGSDEVVLRYFEGFGLAALGRIHELDESVAALDALPPKADSRVAATMATIGGELMSVGRVAEGKRYLARAERRAESKRLASDSAGYFSDRGMAAYYGTDWSRAREWFERAASAETRESLRSSAFVYLGIIDALQGRLDDAAGAMDLADRPEPKASLPHQALIAAASGDAARAVQLVRETMARPVAWDFADFEHILHDPAFEVFRKTTAWQTFVAAGR